MKYAITLVKPGKHSMTLKEVGNFVGYLAMFY
jgi:hypothetical protein